MHTITITDPDDPRLSDYRDLTDVNLRRVLEPAGGLYIAESAKVIGRALRAGHRPRSALIQPKWRDDIAELWGESDAPVYVVDAKLAETLTGYAVHRGALAAMHRPVLPNPLSLLAEVAEHNHPPGIGHSRRRSRVAVLENLTDHTNVGAAFRSAAALGVDAVLVTPQCADPLYRRSIRVSMGTVFQVPWTRTQRWPQGIEHLGSAGYTVAGMTLSDGAVSLDELVAEDHQKLALVFGSEGEGLTAATERHLDRLVTIPMMGGVDSLNVAAATAVAFYATR